VGALGQVRQTAAVQIGGPAVDDHEQPFG